MLKKSEDGYTEGGTSRNTRAANMNPKLGLLSRSLKTAFKLYKHEAVTGTQKNSCIVHCLGGLSPGISSSPFTTSPPRISVTPTSLSFTHHSYKIKTPKLLKNS